MTRTRTAIGCIGTLLLLAFGGSALAQELRIGYINLSAIIQNAPQIPEINQQLRDEFAQRDTEFQEMQADYADKVEQFERDQEVMATSERESLARELTQMQRDLERQSAVLQEDLQIRQNELLGELQVEILEKVQAYAELNDFDLIVTDAVYASDVVNITAAVYEAISASIAPLPAASATE